jgi:D-alanyl-D-alanine carboxypeptidase/D-alanyl-D-alanine-endopeptidase (penicillin-binding protein 4)
MRIIFMNFMSGPQKSQIYLLYIILLFSSIYVNGKSHALKSFLCIPELSCADVGILVKEVQTNKTIVEYRSDKSLMPGSNLKLITTATALNLLGPDFRFATPLQFDGSIDQNGILHGNLYIVGRGDPTIGSEDFADVDFIDKWVMAVKKAGIKAVDGRVIADVSAFDQEVIPPDWVWEDMGNYYAAGVYGLSLDDNLYRLTFRTDSIGTTPKIIAIAPSFHPIIFHNYLKASALNADGSFIHGAPFSYQRTITGTLPANRASFVVKGDLPNPPFALATFFTDQLNHHGIYVNGLPTDTLPAVNSKRTEFYIHYSPDLNAIIDKTNTESNNLFAEHIFKRLALINYHIATREEATQIVKQFWGSHQVDTTSLFIEDGSGLSPFDGVTPDFFVHLLIYMRTENLYGTQLFNSLPVAGQSGTLRNFLVNTPLEGKVHAKSGSIKRVLCYAGYLERNNKEYAFSVMTNNYQGSALNVRKAIEKFLLSLP